MTCTGLCCTISYTLYPSITLALQRFSLCFNGLRYSILMHRLAIDNLFYLVLVKDQTTYDTKVKPLYKRTVYKCNWSDLLN